MVNLINLPLWLDITKKPQKPQKTCTWRLELLSPSLNLTTTITFRSKIQSTCVLNLTKKLTTFDRMFLKTPPLFNMLTSVIKIIIRTCLGPLLNRF